MKEIRQGSSHVVSASRFFAGAKPSQGGNFDDEILCSMHEGATSGLDKYGTEFIRRAETLFEANRAVRSFEVRNPKPRQLLIFALSVVWREVHSANGRRSGLSLGPYDRLVRDAVFAGGALDWPMLVSRQRFTLTPNETVRFGVHPYRIKLADLNAWIFAAAGYAFYLISDKRGLPAESEFLRADRNDPAIVVVGYEQEFRKVGVFQKILSNMRQRGGRLA